MFPKGWARKYYCVFLYICSKNTCKMSECVSGLILFQMHNLDFKKKKK